MRRLSRGSTGIAAVVGTGGATRRLRTGQMVTVDGAAGTFAI
jgi:phosphohistidine swiveling domain-containing protein